eukprot:561089_1
MSQIKLAQYVDISSAIICIVITPSTFYFGYQLHRNWNEHYILARRRSIILCLYIIMCYYQLFYFPFTCLDIAFILDVSYNVRECLHMSSIIGFSIAASLITLRIYLLYFDHEYNHILLTKRWQILFDPSIEKTNWFLINRNTKWGNDMYILQYLLSPVLFIYSMLFLTLRLSLFALYRADSLGSANFAKVVVDFSFYAFSATTAIIISIGFWKRYPNFNDNLFIRKEMTITVGIFAVFPVIAIMIVLALTVFGVAFHEVSAIAVVITSFTMSIIGWMTLKYPQKLFTKTQQNQLPNADVKNKPKMSLHKVLATQEGFESFANFLELEFSIENILFVTEYVQLKHAMLRNETLNDKIVNELQLEYEFNLPDSIPLSLIVSEFGDAMEERSVDLDLNYIVYHAINQIFCKYIRRYAALEVNISSAVRYNLENMFLVETTENQIECVLPLMEAAVVEVSSLMSDSLYRFRGQTVYSELVNIA